MGGEHVSPENLSSMKKIKKSVIKEKGFWEQ